MLPSKTPNKSSSNKLDYMFLSPDKQEFPGFISHLYLSGKYSDLIIKCQDREFKVHRAIVCSQSRPLAAAIDHGFKEATTGEINLEDDELEIVEYMIKFLYNGTYLVIPRNTREKNGSDVATPEEDAVDATPTLEEGLAIESLLSNLNTSPSLPSVNTNTTANTSAQAAAFASQPAMPMNVRNLFGNLSTHSTSATTNDGGNVFVPISIGADGGCSVFVPAATGTASVSDIFRPLPIPVTTSSFTGPTATSGMAFRPSAPVASTSNMFDRQESMASVAHSLFSRRVEEASIAAASSTNDRNTHLPKQRTGWIFTEAGKQWLETESARNFTSGPIFKPIIEGQAENMERLAEDLIKHAKVYIIAEKYDIQPLKNLARRRYSSCLFKCWNSASFVQSIELIFDGTPDILEGDCLRNTIMEASSIHASQLLERGDFLKLCQDRGDIATAVLQARVKFS